MNLDMENQYNDEPWALIDTLSANHIANQFSGIFDSHKNDFKLFAKIIVRLAQTYGTPFKVQVIEAPQRIDYMVFCGDSKRLVWVAPLFKKYSRIRNSWQRRMLGLDFSNKTYH